MITMERYVKPALLDTGTRETRQAGPNREPSPDEASTPNESSVGENTSDNTTSGQFDKDYEEWLSGQEEPVHDITIGQAVKCVTGAIVGMAIESGGNTASSLISILKPTRDNAVWRAGNALWKTDMVGPNIKFAATFLLPVATVAAPVLTAIGSAGYGLYSGGTEGLEKESSLRDVVDKSVRDVRNFHTYLSEDMVAQLQEIEKPHLPPGEESFDIKPVQAAKSLAAAGAGAVIDGVGVTAITWAKLPKATVKLYQAVNDMEAGPVLKNTVRVLLPVPIALSVPLAPVAATVYGVYKGFGDCYNNGFAESVNNRFQDVKGYHQWTSEILEN